MQKQEQFEDCALRCFISEAEHQVKRIIYFDKSCCIIVSYHHVVMELEGELHYSITLLHSVCLSETFII